jgi:hypothetical protein
VITILPGGGTTLPAGLLPDSLNALLVTGIRGGLQGREGGIWVYVAGAESGFLLGAGAWLGLRRLSRRRSRNN